MGNVKLSNYNISCFFLLWTYCVYNVSSVSQIDKLLYCLSAINITTMRKGVDFWHCYFTNEVFLVKLNQKMWFIFDKLF